MAALGGKLTKKLVENLGQGRHGDGSGLYLVVDPSGARRWIVRVTVKTAETYSGEIFRHGIYRVAVCRDSIQWLFQRQRPQFPAGGAAWDTLGYCVSKSGLIRLVRAHISFDIPELNGLPEHFPRSCRHE